MQPLNPAQVILFGLGVPAFHTPRDPTVGTQHRKEGPGRTHLQCARNAAGKAKAACGRTRLQRGVAGPSETDYITHDRAVSYRLHAAL